MKLELSQIIAELNQNLVAEYKTDTHLFDELTKTQSKLGLLYDDRPTCPFLRPHFLSRRQYDEIAHAAETIAEAEKLLTYTALEDKKYSKDLI